MFKNVGNKVSSTIFIDSINIVTFSYLFVHFFKFLDKLSSFITSHFFELLDYRAINFKNVGLTKVQFQRNLSVEIRQSSVEFLSLELTLENKGRSIESLFNFNSCQLFKNMISEVCRFQDLSRYFVSQSLEIINMFAIVADILVFQRYYSLTQ